MIKIPKIKKFWNVLSIRYSRTIRNYADFDIARWYKFPFLL